MDIIVAAFIKQILAALLSNFCKLHDKCRNHKYSTFHTETRTIKFKNMLCIILAFY